MSLRSICIIGFVIGPAVRLEAAQSASANKMAPAADAAAMPISMAVFDEPPVVPEVIIGSLSTLTPASCE